MANKDSISLPGYDGNVILINYTECTLHQLREIWVLRNMPEIRDRMINSKPIDWYKHIDFIENLYGDADRYYWAVYKGTDLVCTFNLTWKKDKVWERGIITSPKYQGTGITPVLEKEILNKLQPELFSFITARVKNTNIRSLRYHEKIGYEHYGTDGEYELFELKLF